MEAIDSGIRASKSKIGSNCKLFFSLLFDSKFQFQQKNDLAKKNPQKDFFDRTFTFPIIRANFPPDCRDRKRGKKSEKSSSIEPSGKRGSERLTRTIRG